MKSYFMNIKETANNETAIDTAIHSREYSDWGRDGSVVWFAFTDEYNRDKFALEFFGIEFQTVNY